MKDEPRKISRLSLVIPFFNEEESIPHLKIRLEQIVSEIGIETEIICIDDGSGDQTPKLLSEWAEKSANVRVMIFSRNFGQQIALTAGLQHTKGDAIVILDADLQDPPELIPKMIKKYEEGFDMVYAQRSDRQGESAFKQATAFIFYRLMRIILGFNLPSDTGDFRLMSRRCLDAFLQMRENHRFLRGMFHWVGFEQAAVSFSRPKREFGTTKYTIRKMLSLSLNAAVSFSALPLRLILILGIAVSLFGMGYAGYSILRFFLVGDTVRGWTTLIVLITLLGGTTLVCLGIIGEYVSRIYDEIKCRPLYLLKETYNFSPRSSND